MAGVIGAATEIGNIVGKVSLTDMIDWVAGAAVIVTNDTMAAHLGVSCNRPTLIIANGNNHLRFTEYAGAGIANVVTLYPRVFLRATAKGEGIRCASCGGVGGYRFDKGGGCGGEIGRTDRVRVCEGC